MTNCNGNGVVNMKVRKVLTCALTILALCALLTGCAQCISAETSTVQVKIVGKKHRARYVAQSYKGRPVRHPAIYQIKVEYKGKIYNIPGRSTYHKYANQVGKMTNATLETRKYDDGTVRYNIVNLG